MYVQWCQNYFSRHLRNDSGKLYTLGHSRPRHNIFDTRVPRQGSREDHFDTGLWPKRRGGSNVLGQLGEPPQAVQEEARFHLLLHEHSLTVSEFASWAALSASSQLS